MADSAPGEDVTIASGLSADSGAEAASFSFFFLSWNRAARSLSRLIFFSDFFLCTFDGFRFVCQGLKWTSSGLPRYAEKLIKAFPFTDSMKRRALVPDLQHL